jgi:probable HAF family extracellular repeat protein
MAHKFRHGWLLFFSVMVFSLCAGENLWAEQYYYYDLGTSSGFTSTYANSINDSGNVAGYALTDSNSARAFLWTPSSGMQNLGTVIPGYGYSMAYGINNNNQIVGVDSGSTFLWTDAMRYVGFSGGAKINNNGTITGSTPVNSNSQAFLWNNAGGIKYLDTLGGRNSYGVNINDSNYVVGSSEINIGSPTYHAFLWTPTNGMQDLNTQTANLPNNTFLSISKSINNNNQIVGQFSTDRFNDTYSFLWTPTDGFKDLGTLCANPLLVHSFSLANSINNNGQVVGGSIVSEGNLHAFSWTPSGGMQDLNNSTLNLPQGKTLIQANDINNKGQIVGIDSNNRAFLLTPKELSKKYALFIGIRDGELRGDLSAQTLADQFKSLGYTTDVLWKDAANGGLKQNEFENKINEIKQKLMPGDTFLLYIRAHGGSENSGSETTMNAGNERFLIGAPVDKLTNWASLLYDTNENTITDNELASMLKGMDTIRKFFLMESCHSGGFWGNKNPIDEGDLEKVGNLALCASATEDKDSYFYSSNTTLIGKITGHMYKNGLGLYDYAIQDAFTKINGRINADYNGDGEVSLAELSRWVNEWEGLKDFTDELVYKEGMGDPTIFTLDKWGPVGFKTDDFIDGLPVNAVPIPSSILLLGSGLLGLSGLGLKRKFSS